MNSKFQSNAPGRAAVLLALVVGLAAGCDRDSVKVYKMATPDAAAAPAAPAPQLKWTLPAGWTEKPAGEMRLASFAAPGKNGQAVDISIVPLPGLAGGDLNNVNRWRGQVGLGPIGADELTKLGESVTVGDAPAQLYDQAGTPPGATAPARILAVGLHRPDMMWFFKATGDDESVASQKGNFIAWLKSIQFADALAGLPAGHPDISGALPPAAAGGTPEMPAGHPDMGGMMPAAALPDTGPAPALPAWTVPPGWQTEPPGAMVLAKFTAVENGAKAEVSVSSFPGDVGGLLANINRWRRQIGLPPIEDAGLAQAVTPLTTPAGPASHVDLTSADGKTRLAGVILPLNGQSWFYKFTGDAAVVDHQKAAFLNFVQSAKY